MSSHKNLIRVAATWLLAGTILFTSSCSFISGLFGASRDDNGTLTGEAKIDIFETKVGDCLVGFQESGDTVGDVTATPCTNKHDAEVYAVTSTTTANAISSSWSENFCDESFEPYIGVGYQDSALYVSFVHPRAGSKDTVVVCIVYEKGVTDSTTSVKGSNK